MAQFWLGILIIAIAAAMGWWGTQVASEGWHIWRHPTQSSTESTRNIYKLMVSSTVLSKYPSPLLYVYNSQLGKTISPISLALFLEVVNNSNSVMRIYRLESRALMRYDEGGKATINVQPNGDRKLTYLPSGNTIERWRTLHSVGFLNDQVYFVNNNDWTKCRRIDFSKNSFEIEAHNKQLQPGESLRGWLFYEMEEDIRPQVLEIKQLEFIITNAAGQTQTIQIEYPNKDKSFPIMSSGTWEIQEGYFDLTKQDFTICPQIDLKTILKEGKGRVLPSDRKNK